MIVAAADGVGYRFQVVLALVRRDESPPLSSMGELLGELQYPVADPHPKYHVSPHPDLEASAVAAGRVVAEVLVLQGWADQGQL